MNIDSTKVLMTPDLYFAAYLKAKDCQIIEIKKEGTKAIFSFDITNSNMELTDLKHGYFNNDKNEKYGVSASIYADAIRSLKTLCHVEDGEKIVTPDLYFAAYLKSKNCTVETASKSDYKTVFIFDVKNSGMSVIELKLGYFNNIKDPKCMVTAADYTDAVRSLKTMCHITSY